MRATSILNQQKNKIYVWFCSTVAIRASQRAIVEMDPAWCGGAYGDGPDACPLRGMGVARALGTTFYRSRQACSPPPLSLSLSLSL